MSIDVEKLCARALAELATAADAARAGGDFVLGAKLSKHRTSIVKTVRFHVEQELTACGNVRPAASDVVFMVEFPIRTFSEGNRRGHWAQGYAQVGDQRPVVAVAVRSHARRAQFRPELPLIVQLTRIAPDALDVGDNLDMCCKHIRDGIADWLGVNDRDPRVQWPRVKQEASKQYGVRIEIRKAAA